MKKVIALTVAFTMALSPMAVLADSQDTQTGTTQVQGQVITTGSTQPAVDTTGSSSLTQTNGSTQSADASQTTVQPDVQTQSETTGQAITVSEDQNTAQDILGDTAGVSQSDVDQVVNTDNEDKVAVQEDQAINNMGKEQTITKQNINGIIKNLYKYLTLRDLYYKGVLNVLKKVKNTSNIKLKKAAIVKFQKKFNAEKEKDKKANQKVEQLIKFLKANKGQMNGLEKLTFNKLLKPALQKYYKNRVMLIYIHKSILEFKKAAFRGEIKKVLAKAEQMKANGNLKQAEKYYEEIISQNLVNDTTYKEAGNVLSQLEGKGPKVFVQGVRPNFDVKPFIKDGSTLVPFRAIAEALKADVQWDEVNRAVIMQKGDKKVVIPIDKNYIEVNGEQEQIDVPATIQGGRTLVPLRVVSEALDTNVTWDSDTQVITVNDNTTDPSNNINASQLTDAGIGNADQIIPTDSEQQIVDEVNQTNDANVQNEVNNAEN